MDSVDDVGQPPRCTGQPAAPSAGEREDRWAPRRGDFLTKSTTILALLTMSCAAACSLHSETGTVQSLVLSAAITEQLTTSTTAVDVAFSLKNRGERLVVGCFDSRYSPTRGALRLVSRGNGRDYGWVMQEMEPLCAETFRLATGESLEWIDTFPVRELPEGDYWFSPFATVCSDARLGMKCSSVVVAPEKVPVVQVIRPSDMDVPVDSLKTKSAPIGSHSARTPDWAPNKASAPDGYAAGDRQPRWPGRCIRVQG